MPPRATQTAGHVQADMAKAGENVIGKNTTRKRW
jgi:hypothetical protein